MVSLLMTAPPDYQHALAGAVFTDETAAGRIFMHGRDRAALLHRLSSNDLLRLRSGEGTQTVLTTPIGRIIDLLTVHIQDDSLLVVTSLGQGGIVYGHLRKNIFFNDQVTVEAAGRTYGQLALYGPSAATVLREVTGRTFDDLPLFSIVAAEIGGAALWIARRKPIEGPSFTLYIRAGQLEPVQALLQAHDVAMLEPSTLDILRVEHGYAAFGQELSGEYIPLETGLRDAISFSKGCYVGQEIIARMESRNRLAKQLRSLRLSHPMTAPRKLTVAGKDAGDLTSAVISPRFGPIGLAYVRSAHAAAGTIVEITGEHGRGEVLDRPCALLS